MKRIQFAILVAATLLVFPQARAETPQAAYGVTVVGSAAGSVGVRGTDLSTHPYVLVGGYYSPGDNGGGYFAKAAPGAPSCTDNGGTIIKDLAGNCFYRMDDRAAIPVKWFGAKCDAVTTVFGGTIANGTASFTVPNPTFQPSDRGKVIELVYKSKPPFRTTINTVSSATSVTLNSPSPYDYPSNVAATGATFASILDQGLDQAGSGYQPNDTLMVQGGTESQMAEVDVAGTGLVNISVSGGQGYAVNDLISFYAADSGFDTKRPAIIQVTSVSNGAVTGYAWVSNGDFVPTTGSGNPTSFTTTSTGGGSGVAFMLLPNDGSFGVAEVNLVQDGGGKYTELPPIPSTLSTMRGGQPATVDLTFPTPSWTYGTDDTAAFQAMESVLEADTNRGVFKAGEVPGGHTCLLSTLQINRPVKWQSSGGSQAQLMQLLGAQGSTVDGIHYGFILAAASYPSFDQYQDVGDGQQWVSLENIMIAGADNNQMVQVDSGQPMTCSLTTAPYCSGGLLFQAPVAAAGSNAAAGVLRNVQVVNFPGHALAAYHPGGELRAYNVFAAEAGGNCVDLENTRNPYRFYGISGGNCGTASGVGIALNLVKASGMEFHGASFFNAPQAIVSVTGTLPDPSNYILFDGLQASASKNEDMYLDQLNETVICAANCLFGDANTSKTQGGSAILIGPDAATIATGISPIVLQLNQGSFNVPDVRKNGGQDIDFQTSPHECNCRVALGSGMVDVATNVNSAQPGAPTTNDTSKLSGQITYARRLSPMRGPSACR